MGFGTEGSGAQMRFCTGVADLGGRQPFRRGWLAERLSCVGPDGEERRGWAQMVSFRHNQFFRLLSIVAHFGRSLPADENADLS